MGLIVWKKKYMGFGERMMRNGGCFFSFSEKQERWRNENGILRCKVEG